MKRKFYILSLILVGTALGITSCSKEDDPTFEFTDPRDGFMPADDATDEISVLRRDFFHETGSYLLFNDTLRHDFIGKDLNGENRYKTELLDVRYEVGQTNSATYKPTYSYLQTTEDCAKAVEYLKTFILPHLSSSLQPFSWFMTGNIYDQNVYGTTIRPYAISGQRSIVLACAQLKTLKTDAQKQQLAKRHLLAIAQNLAYNNSPSFSDFCAVSSNYYNTNLVVPEGETTQSYVRGLGFLNITSAASFPSLSDDINAYASLIINYTDEQIEKTYGDYPLIISKAKMFRADLEKIGYIY